MAAKSISTLLEDVRLLSEEGHALVQAVRALVKQTFGTVDEEVKYGGILFAVDGVSFAGVFAYRQHVSLEFGQGAAITDPYGLLEGAGKGRRHLKLRGLSDLADKQVADYLPLALQAAKG
ncbi:DUF1801 domain-containing protein [Ideonella paludis]|uniref:DUF1801 domain-containing protein n=1 Tax=Ideonella paludis TaxID=1233411 RepID=A0ABS5DTN6_9BURK|nr:DUF1801 domain-containing protein [Ideonella paludis]MBQ0934496.1 DUF1801 domain-containing protein [Ideonella paludis]